MSPNTPTSCTAGWRRLQLLTAALLLLQSHPVTAFTGGLMNVVNPTTGILTPPSIDPNVSEVPRWDSLDRTDGFGTNRSLQGGITCGFEGGTIAGYFAQFTFVGGTTLAQFTTAVNASLATWQSNSPDTFKLTFPNPAVPVVLDAGVAGNKLEGNEIDLFGNAIAGSTIGSTFSYGVATDVNLTSGWPKNGQTFPSSRMYSVDLIMDTSNNGAPWTIAAWQATFTHELGHAIGLGDAEVRPRFFDRDATINNPMAINTGGDVRQKLADLGQQSQAATAGILMRSAFTGLTALQNDDVAGLKFLYPLSVQTPGLSAWGRTALAAALAVLMIGLASRRRSASLALMLMLILIAPVAARGDSVPAATAFDATSPNGLYHVSFVPGASKAARGSGTCRSAGNAAAMWSVDWYARDVLLADDGHSLVRINYDATSPDDEAVTFYSSGQRVRGVKVRDVVADVATLERSSGGRIQWLAMDVSPRISEDGRSLVLLDAKRTTQSFDLATGARSTP